MQEKITYRCEIVDEQNATSNSEAHLARKKVILAALINLHIVHYILILILLSLSDDGAT